MNRNVESYFATTANADIQRSRFDRSQDIKFSFDTGCLVPFFWDEVYPGDTVEVETSKVVRLQTLLTPIMDNIYLDTYFFFVPYRLVWNHWKEFMGENTTSKWLPQVTYSIPQIQPYSSYPSAVSPPTGFEVHSIADYLGLPVGVDGLSVSALPIRSYEMIWNTWFRDENLQDPINTYIGDNTTYLLPNAQIGASSNPKIGCKAVNKYHDYFTSCLPAPLKGAPVLAPIEGSATKGAYVTTSNVNSSLSSGYPMVGRLLDSSGLPESGFGYVRVTANQLSSPFDFNGSVNEGRNGFEPRNLFVGGSDIAGSLGINIMSLRNAFQVQKLLERDARSGTRYIEIIKGHFNVTSPDSRLQRPEYLGGNRIPISIHQITNQSQGQNDFLGDLGAMSLTTDRNYDFIQSFTEHGCIIGVCAARYDHSYPQGIERAWSRKTRFDYYWPEFAHLSEQAVLNKEIYATGTITDESVFGYQEAWADLRYKPNRVAGEMRPGISNSLASWHLADYYTQTPSLSDNWIQEDRTNVDRTLAVTSAVSDQLFCDIYVKNLCTRPMPVRSIPGLADHF